MRLAEPVTTITDYLLAVELLFLAFLLYFRISHQYSIAFWCASFVCLTVSAITGGTFHGFRHLLQESTLTHLWKVTASAIVLSLMLMVVAGVFSAATGLTRQVLLMICIVLLVIGLWIVLMNHRNNFEVRNSVPVLTGLLCFLLMVLLYLSAVDGPPAGKWILLGSMLCIFAGIIQQKGIQFHRHFNHNDIAHVLFMIAMYFLYRGGLLLRDH